ncbi:MAG: ribonuclease P protein component [Defluviitaleaceae bacterium]|nr:ribonuclease P protein component [Defluviitaleaceae bacterium]
MKKSPINSLKKSREFKAVYDNKSFVANRLLVLYVKKTELPQSRLGVAISRKVGNAAARNKLKRRIKEFMRLNNTNYATGYDIVIVARKGSAAASFDQIGQALSNLFERKRETHEIH